MQRVIFLSKLYYNFKIHVISIAVKLTPMINCSNHEWTWNHKDVNITRENIEVFPIYRKTCSNHQWTCNHKHVNVTRANNEVLYCINRILRKSTCFSFKPRPIKKTPASILQKHISKSFFYLPLSISLSFSPSDVSMKTFTILFPPLAEYLQPTLFFHV